MSETGRRPPEFKPVEAKNQQQSLLLEAARTLSSTILWIKDQSQFITTQIKVFSVVEPALYLVQPADLDRAKFIEDLEKSGERNCFFSVSLPKANIFFKAKFIGFDTAGMKFHAPEQIFNVQRRKDVRLTIPMGYVLRIEFEDPIQPEKPLSKKVIDISATGMSFLAESNEDLVFQAGIQLKGIRFSVKGRKMVVDAEVRHCRPFKARTSSASGIKVGIQFTSILPGESQHIAGYVFDETRKYYSRFI